MGSGSEIHGRIIPIGGIRDKTMDAGTDAFPKAIRLVQSKSPVASSRPVPGARNWALEIDLWPK